MPPDDATEGPSFQEILQFDPFSAPETGGEAPPAGDGTPPAEGGTPPPAPSGEENPGGQQSADGTPAPQPGAVAPPGEPPKPTSQADIEAAIRQIPDAIRAGLERVQPQPISQPAATEPKFKLGVPDALVNALRSEDPKEFSAGVGAMINGVANHVWNAFQDHLEKNIGPAIPRMIENYVQTVQRQQSVATDFYGQYPQLNIPELMPVVQAVGATIAQEYARAGRQLDWSPQLRDAIAERIFQRLPMLRGQPAAAQPPARRAFSTGNGARPPAPGNTPQDDMVQVLFGGPGVR